MKQTSLYIRQQLENHFSEGEINQLINLISCHVCHLQTYQFLSDKDKELSEKERSETEGIVGRLLQHEPIQYILGETEFYGLPFEVNSHVLIPRPETEELVEWLIQDELLKTGGGKDPAIQILDIGTGSGCIAVSLAKHLPYATVYGLDISGEALSVAGRNAIKNQVKVQWLQGDILNNPLSLIADPLDLIISNPPYIIPSEKVQMEENVLAYEPHSALFVPEEQPLLFYEQIADFGLKRLKPQGRLYIEINAFFGKETCNMLQQKGYKNIDLKQDISGKDRMIKTNL